MTHHLMMTLQTLKVEEEIGELVVQDDRQEEVIPSVIKDGHYVCLEVAYVEGP